MSIEKEDQICAICRWNKGITHFHCSNKNQEDNNLKNHTRWNDTCELFEEKDQDYYQESNDLKL